MTMLIDQQFFDFCATHSDYRIERSAKGYIVIQPGTGGETGSRNAALTAQLHMWANRDRRGITFASGSLFRLPSSAMRSPDAAWVDRSRLEDLSEEAKERFLPLCPGFVVELTSPSDRLRSVQRKMREWMDNGCQLGWILHASARTAFIYRAGREVETIVAPTQLNGEGPVAGFTLDLAAIWNPGW